MFKRYLFSMALLMASLSSNAQRFSLSELLNIYTVASDPESNSNQIKQSFANESNWSAATFKRDQNQTGMNWNYIFGGSQRGFITVYRDNRSVLPARLAFGFPYLVQYNDYRSLLIKNAKLVNVFSEGLKETEVYELEGITFALTVYPASMNTYYNEGKAVPFYKILIQHIGR